MRSVVMFSILSILPCASHADVSAFSKGPALEDYGPVADVDVTLAIPNDSVFRHSFDVAEQATEGELNRTLESAARFINMHARAGIDTNRIELAVVVHGKAVHNVATGVSGNPGLVAALIDHGVSIIVCGQSAAYYGVATGDLLPGVEMALSAMTAHALLQQQGYTLNPF